MTASSKKYKDFYAECDFCRKITSSINKCVILVRSKGKVINNVKLNLCHTCSKLTPKMQEI